MTDKNLLPGLREAEKLALVAAALASAAADDSGPGADTARIGAAWMTRFARRLALYIAKIEEEDRRDIARAIREVEDRERTEREA
jgi:hypothetical protein